MDTIIKMVIAVIAFHEDNKRKMNNDEIQYESTNFKPNTNIVDTERYIRDLNTYGESYAQIAANNGLYSYVRGF